MACEGPVTDFLSSPSYLIELYVITIAFNIDLAIKNIFETKFKEKFKYFVSNFKIYKKCYFFKKCEKMPPFTT